ncbi:MAG: CocE/NonD family hydrolase [Actinomycetia bacterium]|nr:CocE/NonD family hydrolase [Actinomycetes bacterium]
MTARDGTVLSADVYRPATDGETEPGPFPAILVRSPYDTRSAGPSGQRANGEYFAKRGYLYIVQDSRGRYGSEGEFILLANDHLDGYDAIEWAATLPYCDGRIGTQGTSLRGWNQNAAALERPPHLECMWINQGGWNGYLNSLRHNGALELRWLAWAVDNSTTARELGDRPDLIEAQVANGIDMFEWLTRLPWSEGDSPLTNVPGYERWALDLYRHSDLDDFWLDRSRNFEPYATESAAVPTMYAGSWYDSYSKATVDKFAALARSRQHQYLLMGPGVHGGPNFDRRFAGEVDMGERATIAGNLAESRLALMTAWFDRWLKDHDNGIDTAPAVRLFVMGGGSGHHESGRLHHGGDWETFDRWPIDGTRSVDYQLGPDGALATNLVGGPESWAAPGGGGSASTSFRFDPADPLPTVSANVSSMNELLAWPERGFGRPAPNLLKRTMLIQGGADQVLRPDLHCPGPAGMPLTERPDTLAFTTEPLTNPLDVIGTPKVDIWFSSDASDTDLFVMLLDLYPPDDGHPDGYRLNICDSIMRVRYRHSFAEPKFLSPGMIVRVSFELYPTANRFAVGHQIQVLVSSSSFPRFDVNPNTGEPIGRHTSTRPAINTIHHDATHPSRIILPVRV